MIVSIIIIAGSNTGWAQNLNPVDAEELHRRSREQAQEQQERQNQKDIFLQSKPQMVDDISLPIEKLSFPIDILQLEGERVDKFSWLQQILDQYAGKSIGKDGINLIVKRLTNKLIARGYTTTRIGIPEQDLSTGTLKLTLIPGIIRDIRIMSPDRRANWYTAFPTRRGSILNLRDLEQGLEQIKRVPSQDADMKIAPGDKPGESDILITVKSSTPVRMTVSFDDSGTEATGKLQSSTSLSLDNILGINDLFYISFNKDAEQKDYLYGTRGNSYQYSLPYGYWTFTLAGSSYDYHQTIQGRNQTFVSSGQSENNEFRIQRLIHRDQQSKTSLQFGIIKKHSQSFIDDTEIGPQRKDVTADELGITHRQYYGKTVVDVNLAHRCGVPWFDAQAEPANSEPDSPTTRYKLWTLDAMVTTPVQFGKVEGKYSFNLRGQTTNNVLYTADYLSIGNRYTVRGFDGEQTLSAEKGWFVRNEWSVPIVKEQEVYIGLDYGQVSGSGAQWLVGTKLAGAAVGVRGSKGNLYYDVFISWPIYKPEGYQTDPHPLGFQLTYQM